MTTTFSATATASLALTSPITSPPHFRCLSRPLTPTELDSWPALPDEVSAKLIALMSLDARLKEIRSYLDLVIDGKLPLNHEILCWVTIPSEIFMLPPTCSFCMEARYGDCKTAIEACRLLPEITAQRSHPKIALKSLLERGRPDTTLMVLRWAECDGGPHMTSLRDVVTAVQVRVECGLLTEAFMHQRVLCTRVKENNFNKRASADTSEKLKGQLSSWVEWWRSW
ncbi:hypothetical protein Fmac_028857 [Flemingia macrophylla]|uniref:Uncharacterized protein n=1 Tax=Flemingia macrophylla TaxID=520843 RepID=A0ABD1L8P8_9FABA